MVVAKVPPRVTTSVSYCPGRMADAGRSMGIFVSLVKPKQSGWPPLEHWVVSATVGPVNVGTRSTSETALVAGGPGIKKPDPGDGDTRGGLVLRAGDVRDGGLVKVRVVVRRRIRRTGHTSGDHLDVGGSRRTRWGGQVDFGVAHL